ncbi:pilus assembly protein TadG [Pseudomonas alcaligenes]|uniref:Pilus assembly protein TadG n=1 Tax=Aquipseudomonas alcaligenes TaxID=43263 RepID=A0ABR7RYS8_AQUAC|nr:TadE family protein [Pseudomonas alcaligenes]MBC9250482.1 pilus assembly protein TadG [Pseudomonas alcaligenes]
MARAMHGNRQRGVAMVEFAIALPVLLLLLFGIAEFGRMLFQYNSLLQASRDASRYAASEAWNATLGRVELTSALQTQVKNIAVYGVPAPALGASPAVPCLTTGNVTVAAEGTTHVRVSVSFAFRPVLGDRTANDCNVSTAGLPNFFSNPIPLALTLNASVVMRAL